MVPSLFSLRSRTQANTMNTRAPRTSPPRRDGDSPPRCRRVPREHPTRCKSPRHAANQPYRGCPIECHSTYVVLRCEYTGAESQRRAEPNDCEGSTHHANPASKSIQREGCRSNELHVRSSIPDSGEQPRSSRGQSDGTGNLACYQPASSRRELVAVDGNHGRDAIWRCHDQQLPVCKPLGGDRGVMAKRCTKQRRSEFVHNGTCGTVARWYLFLREPKHRLQMGNDLGRSYRRVFANRARV